MTSPVLTVTVTGAEHAELLPDPRPQPPLALDEIAGTTLASLISPGTELAYNYQGKDFPSYPGYAAVFQVEETGSEITGIQAGDLALCMGNHSSRQRAKKGEFVRLPDGLTAEAAVFARLMAVTMATLTTTRARPPGRVLVTGLGPVGHLGAQIFAAGGYTVLACDPVAERRRLAESRGLATSEKILVEDSAWKEQADLVLECSGHEQAVLDGCRMVRKGGEVVLVGVPWKRRTELSAQELLSLVFHRYVVLRSGWEWELPAQRADFRPNATWQNLEAATRWLADGRVRVDGLYALHSPRDCQQVYQSLLHGKAGELTAVFDWRQIG
jgi:threonine dehydrogenase-like Zn-dependent dehydrogenase